jgi:hypothetical protein
MIEEIEIVKIKVELFKILEDLKNKLVKSIKDDILSLG